MTIVFYLRVIEKKSFMVGFIVSKVYIERSQNTTNEFIYPKKIF